MTTLMTPSLTAAEKAAFETNGYHLLRNALTPDEVARYRAALLETLQIPESHPYFSCLGRANLGDAPGHPDNPHGIWAGFDLPLLHDRLYDAAFTPKLVLTVDALIGPDINLYETSFVSKNPGFPGSFRDWHQDSEYMDPQSNTRNVTVIIALNPMDGQSGATWVVPGSHQFGPLPHTLPTETLTSGAREVADKARFDAEGLSFSMQAGDALIFLVRLVHKSGPNLSDQLQLSLAYNYVRKDNYDLDKIARWIGAGIPVTRGGRVYAPGTISP
jgi:ectoine hydroxylase-related dioxygenase (phytanoyl-CoA dioxygenase family)